MLFDASFNTRVLSGATGTEQRIICKEQSYYSLVLFIIYSVFYSVNFASLSFVLKFKKICLISLSICYWVCLFLFYHERFLSDKSLEELLKFEHNSLGKQLTHSRVDIPVSVYTYTSASSCLLYRQIWPHWRRLKPFLFYFYFYKFCTTSFQLVSILLPLLRRFCSHLCPFVCWLVGFGFSADTDKGTDPGIIF